MNICSELAIKMREKRAQISDNTNVLFVPSSSKEGHKVVQIWIITKGCKYNAAGQCFHCDYGVGHKVDEERVIKEIEGNIRMLDDFDSVILEACGSILDESEVPQNLVWRIFELLVSKMKPNTLSFETHPNTISKEVLEKINQINAGRKNIGFEFGFEDANPDIRRNCINKLSISNQKMIDVTKMIASYGFFCEVNIIYGYPLLTPSEQMDAVISSCEWVKENLEETDIVLFPMNIKPNTLLHFMYEKGLYYPASLWGFVEVLNELPDSILGTCFISWYGNRKNDFDVLEAKMNHVFPTTCPKCHDDVMQALDSFYAAYDATNREATIRNRRSILQKLINSSKCNCRENFLKSLKEDNKLELTQRRKKLEETLSAYCVK